MRCTIWVESKDAKVGDEVTAYRTPGSTNSFTVKRTTVTSVNRVDQTNPDDRFETGTGRIWFGGQRPLEWMVTRDDPTINVFVTEDLLPGDQIWGCATGVNVAANAYSAWPGYVVVKVAPGFSAYSGKATIDLTLVDPKGLLKQGKEWTEQKTPKEFYWQVRRSGAVVHKAKADSAKKVIDDFPEKCPRCGADAYVGSWEVAHRNEQAAAGCPARRV